MTILSGFYLEQVEVIIWATFVEQNFENLTQIITPKIWLCNWTSLNKCDETPTFIVSFDIHNFF